MSETLFVAMRATRTPEEFVERFVLPGLAVRDLPDARKIWTGMTGRPPAGIDRIMSSLGKGQYHSIMFVNEADPRRVCNVGIGYSRYTDPQLIARRGTRSSPQAKVFSKPFFYVRSDDFDRAAETAGTASTRHPGRSGSISVDLLIPRKAVDHDEWTPRLSEIEGAGMSIQVVLKPEAFQKLEAHQRKESFLREYLTSLKYASGGIEPGRYESHLMLRKKHRERYGSLSPYQIFHSLNNKHRDLMRELSLAPYPENILKVLKQRLGVKGLFAKFYANAIYRSISTEAGSKGAEKIAADAFKPVGQITEPQQKA